MLRLTFTIEPSFIKRPGFILIDIGWAQKYQLILDSITTSGMQVNELIRIFTQVPLELDCSEFLAEYIYSIDPSVYESGKNEVVDYLLETLMEEYYIKLDATLRGFHLDPNQNYEFVAFYDKRTLLLKIK